MLSSGLLYLLGLMKPERRCSPKKHIGNLGKPYVPSPLGKTPDPEKEGYYGYLSRPAATHATVPPLPDHAGSNAQRKPPPVSRIPVPGVSLVDVIPIEV